MPNGCGKAVVETAGAPKLPPARVGEHSVVAPVAAKAVDCGWCGWGGGDCWVV